MFQTTAATRIGTRQKSIWVGLPSPRAQRARRHHPGIRIGGVKDRRGKAEGRDESGGWIRPV
eukprot:417467-Alexandrium_andersonii.AAC.1